MQRPVLVLGSPCGDLDDIPRSIEDSVHLVRVGISGMCAPLCSCASCDGACFCVDVVSEECALCMLCCFACCA